MFAYTVCWSPSPGHRQELETFEAMGDNDALQLAHAVRPPAPEGKLELWRRTRLVWSAEATQRQ